MGPVTIMDFRNRLGELAAGVAYGGGDLVVTLHGKPHVRLTSARGQIEQADAGPVASILAGRETGRVERAVRPPNMKGS